MKLKCLFLAGVAALCWGCTTAATTAPETAQPSVPLRSPRPVTENWGAEDPASIQKTFAEADRLRKQGKYREAETALKLVLANLQQRRHGPDHPDIARSLDRLAWLAHALGRYEEAERLYRRALAALEKKLGATHPDTLSSINNLAELCRDLDRYGETEQLYQRALKASERVHGKDHVLTAVSIHGLAELHRHRGRYDDAEASYRRALAIREKALGPDHPSTAESLEGLATLLLN